jgi:hypothetical protein
MKLKEQTFAVIAEKQNSISHKWFIKNTGSNISWGSNKEWTYLYYFGKWDFYRTELKHFRNCPIYTESQLEELIKKEESEEMVKVEFKADYSKEAFGTLNFTLNEPKLTISNQFAREIIAERFNLQPNDIRIE